MKGGSALSGFSGGGLGAVKGIAGLSTNNWLSSLMGMLKGGDGAFSNLMDVGSLALSGYGLNKSLGIQEDQLGILKEQEADRNRNSDKNFFDQQFMANQVGGNVSLAGLTPEQQQVLLNQNSNLQS